MTDTVRTTAYLQNALRDGQTPGSIIPQILRDFVVSTLSATVGITAAGTTQGTATALTSVLNVVTTVPSGTGVILTSGIYTIVMNRGANNLLIYPPSTGQLESLATNAGFVLQPGADATILFDPSSLNRGYVTVTINAYALPTSLPAVAGIVWNDGGIVSIS